MSAAAPSARAKRPGKPLFMSSQRETFCRLIALEGMTGTDAYRHAFGSKGKPETVATEAWKLKVNPEVAQRIQELRNSLVDRSACTLDNHLAKLAELREIATQTGQVGAAVSAERFRGMASGLYIERQMTSTASLEELVAGRAEGSETTRAPKHEKSPPVKAGSARSKRKKRR